MSSVISYLSGKSGFELTETSAVYRANGVCVSPHVTIGEDGYEVHFSDRVEMYNDLDFTDVETEENFRAVIGAAVATKVCTSSGLTYMPVKPHARKNSSPCDMNMLDRVGETAAFSNVGFNDTKYYLWAADCPEYKISWSGKTVTVTDKTCAREISVDYLGRTEFENGSGRSAWSASGAPLMWSDGEYSAHFSRAFNLGLNESNRVMHPVEKEPWIKTVVNFTKVRERVAELTGQAPCKISGNGETVLFTRKNSVMVVSAGGDTSMVHVVHDGTVTSYYH